MSFDTVTFWLFFAVAWAAWRGLPFGAAKSAALLLSLLFYGWWNPIYLPLLVASAGLDFLAAAAMARAPRGGQRRAWLLVSLSANLGLLGVFKYAPFVLENGRLLLGLPAPDAAADWVVPVGISFYTFQTLSYSLDVYAGRLAPVQSFRDFLLFVSFFPQLVAGPIVRAGQMLPQLVARRPLRAPAVMSGLEHIIWGLFLKVVVADPLAAPVAVAFDPTAGAALTPAAAWTGAACFSAQVFADFAGYSGIAIGLAALLGLRFPANFRWPYAASGPAEFWRRWHITLSTWLRDYLYVPLGGSRRGTARTLVNLMLVMLLGGLWHGAAWTFVAWGALHGAALVVERVLGGGRGASRRPAAPGGPLALLRRLLRIALFNVFVLVSWVFFRAEDLPSALTLLERMLVAPFREPLGTTAGADGATSARYLVLVAAVALMHLAGVLREWRWIPRAPGSRAVLAGLALLALTVMRRSDVQEFLYFQF